MAGQVVLFILGSSFGIFYGEGEGRSSAFVLTLF